MNGYLITAPKNYHPLSYWLGHLINYICGGKYFAPIIKSVVFTPEANNISFVPIIKTDVFKPLTRTIRFTPTSKSFTYKPKG